MKVYRAVHVDMKSVINALHVANRDKGRRWAADRVFHVEFPVLGIERTVGCVRIDVDPSGLDLPLSMRDIELVSFFISPVQDVGEDDERYWERVLLNKLH